MLSTILRVLKKVLIAGTAWLITLFSVLFIGSALGLADAGEAPSAVYSLSAVFVPIIVAILSALPKRKKPAPNAEVSGTEPASPKAQDNLSDTTDSASSLDSAFLPLPEVPSHRNSVPSNTSTLHKSSTFVAPLLSPITVGLFPPKVPSREMECVQGRLNQLQDTIHLVNSTVNPEVFFKRLNFALDILLDLRDYEKYGIFKGSTPTSDYNEIIRNMEAIVDAFIDRAIEDNKRKRAALKTEKAREKSYDKFVTTLISAFDCANTFWSGSFSQTRVFPHYRGPLFTQNNYKRVQSLFYDIEHKQQ